MLAIAVHQKLPHFCRLRESVYAHGQTMKTLRLEKLLRGAQPALAVDVRTASAALIATLEHHHGSTFTIVTHALADRPDAPGSIDVLIEIDAADADIERVTADFLDMADGTPPLWQLVELESAVAAEALERASFADHHRLHVAELARREAPTDESARSFGFRSGGARHDSVNPTPLPWKMWALACGDPFGRRAAQALLAQDAGTEVTIRTQLRPTDLLAEERAAINQLIEEIHEGPRVSTLEHLSALRLEHMLDAQPIFEVRSLVASPTPLSSALLSTLGWNASPPRDPDGSDESRPLAGGYQIERFTEEDGKKIWNTGLDGPIHSLAPAELRRMRIVMGPWEASQLFKLPCAVDWAFPGIEVDQIADLGTPIADLPSHGVELGRESDLGLAVRLPDTDRLRHLHIVGQPGTGKSTLLQRLICQDIENGHGCAVVDPHGDLIDAVLSAMSADRLDDVILIDPASPESKVSVNLLESDTPAQRELVVSELCDMAYRLFDPGRTGIVGPLFEAWLRGAAQLIMDSDTEGTLLDIPRVFAHPSYRNSLRRPDGEESFFLDMIVSDEQRANRDDFLPWFASKFEPFRTTEPVRNFVGAGKSTISFRDAIDDRSIVLVDLGKGRLGAYNAALIGFVVFTRLWTAATSREPSKRDTSFFVYADEFQTFTTGSLPSLLAEARKFGIGLTLAHQFGSQLSQEVRGALAGAVANRVTFRVGHEDAMEMSDLIGPAVGLHDLTMLPNFQAIASISPGGQPVAPFGMQTSSANPIDQSLVAERRRTLISRTNRHGQQ